MSEIPWPAEPVEANLAWSGNDEGWGYLRFIAPDGDKSMVPVSRDPAIPAGVRTIWHIEVEDDIATVNPSIHLVGRWHSPNPVRFKLVERKIW